MRGSGRLFFRFVLGLLVLMLPLLSSGWLGGGKYMGPSPAEAIVTPEVDLPDQANVVFDQNHPAIRAVMAVQNRHTDFLMAQPGVVGTATGLASDQRPAVLVLIESFEKARPAVIPASLDGVPIIVKITGKIKALKRNKVDPTKRFDRPVPIGVSTGHPAITAGTIGARVTDGTDVYALSNNHVYANENLADLGDAVIQPGAFDEGSSADDIGTLSDFEPICFSVSQPECNDGFYNEGDNNTIDAAIALSSTDNLGNATPSDGYGKPKLTTFAPAVNDKVKKYGRTTRQTTGQVFAINATVDVQYDTAVARFVDQIIITPGSFSAGGDSGSLIVFDGKGRNKAIDRLPVGLLFAGSTLVTIGNPIDAVLDRFGVTIDGE